MWNTLHLMCLEVIHNLLISFEILNVIDSDGSKHKIFNRMYVEKFLALLLCPYITETFTRRTTDSFSYPSQNIPAHIHVQLHSNIHAISYSSLITGRRSGRYNDDYRKELKKYFFKAHVYKLRAENLLHIVQPSKIHFLFISTSSSAAE